MRVVGVDILPYFIYGYASKCSESREGHSREHTAESKQQRAENESNTILEVVIARHISAIAVSIFIHPKPA